MSTLRALLPSRAMAVALVALFLNLTGIAYAATGGNFILGQPNTATTQTGLTANFAGRTLQLTNTNATAGASPLGLTTATGRPPFFTNSATKVANLNADKLDWLDSTGFYQAGSTVADSTLFDGHDYASTLAAAKPHALVATWYHGVYQNFSASFHVPAGGATVLVMFNASAYSQTVSGGLVLCAELTTGTTSVQGACAAGSANETLSHKTLVPEPGVLWLPEGDYTATITGSQGTLTNVDDRESLIILEVN